MQRALSRFAYHRSQQMVLDHYGEPEPGTNDIEDPRQIGQWVERKFDEYGMDLPDETREMIDAAREGHYPEQIGDL